MPQKTCLKLGCRIFHKGVKNIFFASTHGTPTLVDFYTYVELNKYTIVKCPRESVAYKAVKVE
jgi:hypothetical protein